MSKIFDYFVGIDWSGAKGSSHKGIAIALSSNNTNTIEIVRPRTKYWSRQGVLDYIINLASENVILVGIDFAFSYPFTDKETFFSNLIVNSPKSSEELWKFIDFKNQDQDDLYGGAIWKDKILGEFYNSPIKRGKFFESRRRLTEIFAKKIRSPSPTFNCVGPAGVGTGSLAGMRLLHKIKTKFKKKSHIWPFDPYKNLESSQIVLAEIFPSYYFHFAGESSINKKGREEILLLKTLDFYNQKFTSKLSVGNNDNDDMDAIVSCAALKYFVKNQIGFTNPFRKKHIMDASSMEGWIFGVN